MKFHVLLLSILFLLIFSTVTGGQETAITSFQNSENISNESSNVLPNNNWVEAGRLNEETYVLMNPQFESSNDLSINPNSLKSSNMKITTQSVSLSKLVVSVDLSHVPVNDAGWVP